MSPATQRPTSPNSASGGHEKPLPGTARALPRKVENHKKVQIPTSSCRTAVLPLWIGRYVLPHCCCCGPCCCCRPCCCCALIPCWAIAPVRRRRRCCWRCSHSLLCMFLNCAVFVVRIYAVRGFFPASMFPILSPIGCFACRSCVDG